MSNSGEIRWRQRLESFGQAFLQLKEACAQASYTNLERAGLVQTFMFTNELAWKAMKDLLFHEGHDVNSPRAVIRQGFQTSYLSENDCEILLDALEKRNMSSHIYQKDIALEAEALIKDRYHPVLVRLQAGSSERALQ